MSKSRVTLMFGITALLVTFMAGCENCTWELGDKGACQQPPVTAPTVTTVPAGGAVGQAVNTVVTATFSTPMNSGTINGTSFTLTGPGGVPVSGNVNATGSTATFTPTSNLAPKTSYTITITTGAQSTAGAGLAAVYTAAFTTLDSPFVISTVPASGAGGVAVTSTVTATFNQPMDTTTLTGSTFTLTGPGGAVPGAVTASGSSATFTPTSNLAVNTLYTATITTGAKNVAGNPLLSNYVWTFTTVNPLAVLSTNPLRGMFSVPLNQIITASFNQPLNPTSLTPLTFTVTGPGVTPVVGTVSGSFAGTTANVATFTPTGGLLPNTDYVATLTTGVTSRSGDVMAANYVWNFSTSTPPVVISTIPANSATGVLLAQTISATFSKPMNPATITAATFTLTGPGATPVVGAVNSVGATATFAPGALLTQNTLYTATITTGARDTSGLALVSNYVWTFRTVPTPVISPTVIATNPVNNASAVPINQKISATFSEAMDPATLNSPATNFTLTGPGTTVVPGTVAYVVSGSTATFTPTANLLPSTLYTATITTGAKNLAGTALASNYVWSFTTALAPDLTRPTIISTIPANLAVAVPINQAVSATFSKAMDAATISGTTFTLTRAGGIVVPGLVTYAAVANTATFTPLAPLVSNTLYTATVTTGAKDLAGNLLGPGVVPNPWTFTTAPSLDTVKPTIISTNPINASANVPINATVNATFSKPMDPLTITTATFQLAGPGGAVITGTVAYDPINFIATFTPSSNLAGSTTYVATVTTGAADLSGNPLGPGIAPNPWTFTTALAAGPAAVNLRTAATFGTIGGGAGMTNEGILTVINGDIGTTAVSTKVTGFHDLTVPYIPFSAGCIYTETGSNIGTVNGTIYTAPPTPTTLTCPNEGTTATMAIATAALADANTAYIATAPAALACTVCAQGGELGNLILLPGVYQSAPGTFDITLGDLTLDAKGNPNASWVFQMGSALTVGLAGPAGFRSVNLVNGALAKNVFWHVGSQATINGTGGGTMVGTIIAPAGVTFSTTGSTRTTTLNGRALGLTAIVTMWNTIINVPAP